MINDLGFVGGGKKNRQEGLEEKEEYNEVKRRGQKWSFFLFFRSFCRAGMQDLSLRLMTSKLVSLVAQVTIHPTPPQART